MEQVEECIYVTLAFKRKHAEGTISEKGKQQKQRQGGR